MRRRRLKSDLAAGLFYVSLPMLRMAALQHGERTGSFAPRVDVEVTGSLNAGIPKLAPVSLRATVRAAHIDPGREERRDLRVLEGVVSSLWKSGVRSLESGEDGIPEVGWVYFRRRLSLGAALDDLTRPGNCLVAVDEHVPAAARVPGLMMSESLSGVRPRADWEESPQDRRAIALPVPGAPLLAAMRSSRQAQRALAMYRLLTEGRLELFELPQLLHTTPCEGIAQVSYTAEGEERALVVARPLYIRVRPLVD